MNNETRDNAEGRDDSRVSGGASRYRQEADMTAFGHERQNDLQGGRFQG